MKKYAIKAITLVLMLSMLFSVVSTVVYATDGQSDDYYRITTAEQLNEIRNNLGGKYILCANINLSGQNWEPIGTLENPFTGTFDGNGYTISNVTINRHLTMDNIASSEMNIGFFGYTNGATIKNLGIENASYNVTTGDFSDTNFSNVGGIAGTLNNTNVECSYFKGSISNSAGSYVFARSGGIAAIGLNSSVTNCYNHSSIYANAVEMNTMAAGIVAWLDAVTIDKCYAAGSVVSENNAGYCYSGGMNASGNASSIFGIILSYGGTVKNSVVLLDTLTANGTENLCDNIGNFSEHSNNTVLSADSSEAIQQSTYESLGWDFTSVWTVGTSYPQLKLVNQSGEGSKLYSETYGWCLANNKESFGYPNDYKIPLEQYYELYGISLGTLIKSSATRLTTWNGNCFGLALLSLAEYYNIVDLSSFFSKSGDTLYEYGYESIYTDTTGKQCFSVENNKAVIDMIEKALISQDSVEFSECEILQKDSDFSKLISFLFSDEAKPIMVTFWSGMSGHAMVLTTDTVPTQLPSNPDWYCIPAYDSNAPANSDILEDPMRYYLRGDSWLLVNPKTSEWRYYANGQVQMSNTYNSFEKFSLFGNITGQTIFYYDVSKLNSQYFTETLNLWHYRIQLKFSSKNIEIKDDNNNIVFKIEDGEIKQIAENYYLKIDVNDLNNSSDDVYTLFSNDYNNLNITSNETELLAINDNYAFISSSNDFCQAKIDFTSGLITSTALSQNTKTIIGVQDLNSNQSILINTDSNENSFVSLQLSNEESVIISSPDMIVDYAHENIDTTNIHHHSLAFEYNSEMHWYKCINCENLQLQKESHEFGDWVITKEATEYENGTKEKSCVCGHAVTEEIPKKVVKTDPSNPSTDSEEPNEPAPSDTLGENNEASIFDRLENIPKETIIIIGALVAGVILLVVICAIVKKKRS